MSIGIILKTFKADDIKASHSGDMRPLHNIATRVKKANKKDEQMVMKDILTGQKEIRRRLLTGIESICSFHMKQGTKEYTV